MKRMSPNILAGILFSFGFETGLAVVFIILNKSVANNSFFMGLSFNRWLLILPLVILLFFFLSLSFYVYKNQSLYERVWCFTKKQQFQPGIVLILLSISLFIIYQQYPWAVIEKLLPVLFCFWLIGIETLILFPYPHNEKPFLLSSRTNQVFDVFLAGLSFVCLGITCLLSSGVPAIFNGVPWDTPIEFAMIAIFLPLSLLINWRSFSKYWIVVPSLLILIIKVSLMIFAPQYGIEIEAFRSPEDMRSGQWIKSYETLFNHQITTIMQGPYNHFREFPVEWINYGGYPAGKTWIGLHLAAYGTLEEGEKLVFAEQNVIRGQVNLINLMTGETIQASLVDDSRPLDANVFQKAASMRKFKLDGILVFQGDQIYHLRPVILKSDGSQSDPFEQGKIWRSIAGITISPIEFNIFKALAFCTDILLTILILASLVWGLAVLLIRNTIVPLDLFLGCSALLGSFLFQFTSRAEFSTVLHWVLVAFLIIELVYDIIWKQAHRSSHYLMIAVLPILLLGFFINDYGYFRQIEVFPKGQDSLGYQTLARLIYTQGDFWLRSLPPRGYKILFPYLVGAQHLVFGQSSVALYLINAWCAGLTAIKLADILYDLKLPSFYSSLAGLLFFYVVAGPLFYIFYFRFGLIEPVATLCLLMALFYASQCRYWPLVLAGMLTTLFRLDYFGAAFGAILLMADTIQGSFHTVVILLTTFIRVQWKKIITYGVTLIILPASFIFSYFFAHSNYELNASDTKYNSVLSMLKGLLKIASGGAWSDIQQWLAQYPLDILILITLLYLGVLSGLLPILFRKGPFKSVDPRLGLIILGYFGVYIIVSPTGYAPRFSTPLLPLALITLLFTIHSFYTFYARKQSNLKP